MFEPASAIFSIADAGEFRFARFYIVYEEVPLGTLFAVYTGMCYCDIQELTNDNITRGIDGNQWLQYYRKKTNQRVSLPLLQPAARILMQYATHKDTHQHLPIFQVPCNQVINRSLKQIATIAKVNKKITFHMARHNKNYIYLNMK